jgi:valyl-tRNA synthetase
MIAPYPAGRGCIDAQAEEEMALIIEIIRSIRNARAVSSVESSRWVEARVYARDRSAVEAHRRAIETLARVQPLTVLDRRRENRHLEGDAVLVLRDAEIVLPMMTDQDAERRRLQGEKQTLEVRIADLRVRLDGEAFINKAPAAVVEKERRRLLEAEDRLRKIEERLAQLHQGP